MEEGVLFAAEVANADNNNLSIPPTITKLDLSSVGPPLPLNSLFKRTKSSIKQNVSTITRAVCSSGFISAVKAEITNNNGDEEESNVDDESNNENDIGWYHRTPPPAPSKKYNKKRVFIELGDDNNEQQEEGVVSRLSNAFSRSVWNVKNDSGFRDRPLNPKLVKRLRETNTSPSDSTSNTPTNNATDTTTAVEEEELEFFTENGGFNNEEGDALPGDGTSTGELNDEEDSIRELMDISDDEENSPSTITSAVSNTGGTESVANDLILEGELQSLAAVVADNNVLPAAAEKESQSGTGEVRPPEVGDIMSLKYEGTGDAVGVVCEVTQDNLSLAFADKGGDVNHVERGIPFTDEDLKYVNDKKGGIKKGTVPEGWKEWKLPESDDTDECDQPVTVKASSTKGVTEMASGNFLVRVYYQARHRSVGTFPTLEQAMLASEIVRNMLKKDKGLKLSAEESERNFKLALAAALAAALTDDTVDSDEEEDVTVDEDYAAICHGARECPVKNKLALYIKKYCKEKQLDLKRQLPDGTPDKIIAAFEKQTKLKVPGRHTWDTAVAIARKGKSVWGGDENGLSGTYANTRRAEVKGMNDKGFAATFPNGKEGAKQFCDNYVKAKEVEAKYFELLGTGLDPVEAFRKMDKIMSKNQATKIVLETFYDQLLIDYTQINNDTAREILDKISEMELDVNLFKPGTDEEDEANMYRILGSVAVDGKVKVSMAILWVQTGLAFVSTRLYVNDEGEEEERDDLYLPVPKSVPKQDCQGQTKFLRGNPLDFERTLETSGHLIIGLASGAVITSNAGIGDDGYTYTDHPSKSKPIFREIIISPTEPLGITRWEVGSMKSGSEFTSKQVHQIQICVTAAFGASVYHECHYKSGGLLEGVLEEGETWNDKFDCKVKSARKYSLVKKYGEKQMPNQCDGDHLFGRSELYLNGFLLVQQVPHRENIVRAFVRRRAGEWLYPLTFGAYKGGNPMPVEWKERSLVAV